MNQQQDQESESDTNNSNGKSNGDEEDRSKSSQNQRSTPESSDGSGDDTQTNPDVEPPESATTNQGELTSENEQPEQGNTERGVSVRPDEMSADEARKLLQTIRDRQMARRALLQQRARTRKVPVEKDW